MSKSDPSPSTTVNANLLPPEKMAQDVYKILTGLQWQAFQHDGFFDGSPDDKRDGFIHLSFYDQLAGTVARHFSSAVTQESPLVLLRLDAPRLGQGLLYEPSRKGALFPHFYGRLLLSAVLAKHFITVGRDGHIALSLGDAMRGIETPC